MNCIIIIWKEREWLAGIYNMRQNLKIEKEFYWAKEVREAIIRRKWVIKINERDNSKLLIWHKMFSCCLFLLSFLLLIFLVWHLVEDHKWELEESNQHLLNVSPTLKCILCTVNYVCSPISYASLSNFLHWVTLR